MPKFLNIYLSVRLRVEAAGERRLLTLYRMITAFFLALSQAFPTQKKIQNLLPAWWNCLKQELSILRSQIASLTRWAGQIHKPNLSEMTFPVAVHLRFCMSLSPDRLTGIGDLIQQRASACNRSLILQICLCKCVVSTVLLGSWRRDPGTLLSLSTLH